MSILLPPTIALRAVNSNRFLNHIEGDSIRASGQQVLSPLAKFEVVSANTGAVGLVHIRCASNKKFWQYTFSSMHFISAVADEPEENQSTWSCTLFEPRAVSGFPDRIRFYHVSLRAYASVLSSSALSTSSVAAPADSIMEVIDLKSLMIMPRHVAFKGHNGKYLAVERVNNVWHLAFNFDDKGAPETWFEVSTDGFGWARIRSHQTQFFWSNQTTDNWIRCNVITVGTASIGSDFWPVKVNNTTIALIAARSNLFCSILPFNTATSLLSAAHSSIAPESHLVMEELILSRSIYNADFALGNARIYGETPVTMATANASNNSKAENTIEFRFAYTESRSSTWTSSNSWMAGVSVEASFRIPFIGGGSVTAHGEYGGSYEWGETITNENTLETTYSVVVLPGTSVSVSLVATKGKCDVPYSYYQRDVLYNGKTVVYKKDDGLYIGINSYNFHYEVATLSGSGRTIVTKEEMLPNPLTDPSVEQIIPIPLPSAKPAVPTSLKVDITQESSPDLLDATKNVELAEDVVIEETAQVVEDAIVTKEEEETAQVVEDAVVTKEEEETAQVSPDLLDAKLSEDVIEDTPQVVPVEDVTEEVKI